MSNKEKNTKAEKEKKSEYKTPELKEYGTIERKTGGGTGSNVEGSMSMSSLRRPS